MKSLQVSVVATILNEEKTIQLLLQALLVQTVTPKEVVIVDGGSSDKTWELLESWKKGSDLSFTLKITQKKGNRSVGRNEAIKIASADLIAITDAGCVPRKNWLEELLTTYKKETYRAEEVRVGRGGWIKEVVVAGAATVSNKNVTPFQSAVVPYVLVMPDKVNPDTFLPATRSMLLPKPVWQELGGFDESLDDNEDYAFAKKLEKLKHDKYCSIVYAPNAVVEWQPRQNLKQFAHMVYRFARGDAYAGIFRPKVGFIFLRYLVALSVLFLSLVTAQLFSLYILFFGFIFYSLWAVLKNAKYVAPKSWGWLVVLQYVSDLEVLRGSVVGLVKRYL